MGGQSAHRRAGTSGEDHRRPWRFQSVGQHGRIAGYVAEPGTELAISGRRPRAPASGAVRPSATLPEEEPLDRANAWAPTTRTSPSAGPQAGLPGADSQPGPRWSPATAGRVEAQRQRLKQADHKTTARALGWRPPHRVRRGCACQAGEEPCGRRDGPARPRGAVAPGRPVGRVRGADRGPRRLRASRGAIRARPSGSVGGARADQHTTRTLEGARPTQRPGSRCRGAGGRAAPSPREPEHDHPGPDLPGPGEDSRDRRQVGDHDLGVGPAGGGAGAPRGEPGIHPLSSSTSTSPATRGSARAHPGDDAVPRAAGRPGEDDGGLRFCGTGLGAAVGRHEHQGNRGSCSASPRARRGRHGAECTRAGPPFRRSSAAVGLPARLSPVRGPWCTVAPHPDGAGRARGAEEARWRLPRS